MRALRTLVSALCILAGAVLIVASLASSYAVRAVEEGTALGAVARTALSVPAVVDSLSARAQDHVLGSLEERGLDPAAVGLDDDLRAVVDDAVRSEAFDDALIAAADDSHAQFARALSDPDRSSAPLTLQVDVSPIVNARIDDLPAVGAIAPDVSVAPIPIEVLDAAAMDDARAGYAAMQWLAQWGLWAGIALLVVGTLVSHRRRWFVAKALLALGVLSLGFGLVVRFVAPETVVAVLPGGNAGTLGTLWAQTFTEEAAEPIANRAMLIGAAALAIAAVAALLGRSVGRR